MNLSGTINSLALDPNVSSDGSGNITFEAIASGNGSNLTVSTNGALSGLFDGSGNALNALNANNASAGWPTDLGGFINGPGFTSVTDDSQIGNGAGYINGYTETDPVFTTWHNAQASGTIPLVNSAATDPNISSDGSGNLTANSLTANSLSSTGYTINVTGTTSLQATGLTPSGTYNSRPYFSFASSGTSWNIWWNPASGGYWFITGTLWCVCTRTLEFSG